MTTRYSLPKHLSPGDQELLARARKQAAVLWVVGVFALTAVVCVVAVPNTEPTVAAAPDVPAAFSLPGA